MALPRPCGAEIFGARLFRGFGWALRGGTTDRVESDWLAGRIPIPFPSRRPGPPAPENFALLRPFKKGDAYRLTKKHPNCRSRLFGLTFYPVLADAYYAPPVIPPHLLALCGG
jgi:hypothetical protein